jgi:hypothetical protein
MSQHVEPRSGGAPTGEQPGFLRWKFTRPGKIISAVLIVTAVTAMLNFLDTVREDQPATLLNVSAAVLVNFVADAFTYHWEVTGQKRPWFERIATFTGAGVITVMAWSMGLGIVSV